MKAIVILSGGLDSSVLLWHLLAERWHVDALSFDYGQRHRRELQSAADVVSLAREEFKASVRHDVVDLRGVGALLSDSGSALVSSAPVPHGHYEDESMKQTVVPNRNMIMLSVAAGVAIARKADVVSYAAHAGDHAIYPDCRADFAEAVDKAIHLADWHEVGLARPFVSMTKAEIAKRGHEIGAPMSSTWSCYEGGEVHCGKCGTCVERQEAFAIAGANDPTRYA